MKNSKLKIEDFLDNILNQTQSLNVSGGQKYVIPPPVVEDPLPIDPPPSSGSGTPIGPTPPPPPPIINLG